MKGILIILEGIDGAGKTSTIAEMKKQFEAQGRVVFTTSEPYGTELGKQVHNVAKLLNKEADSELIATLYKRAILENLTKYIKPALTRGEVVICDRSLISTAIYQKMYSQEGSVYYALKATYPENTQFFYLNVSAETAHKRITQRDIEPDEFKCGGQRNFEKRIETVEELQELKNAYDKTVKELQRPAFKNEIKVKTVEVETLKPSKVAKTIIEIL